MLTLLVGLALTGFWIAERLSSSPDPQSALSSQEDVAKTEEPVDDVARLSPAPDSQAPIEADASRTELESGLAATDEFVHGRVVSGNSDAFPGLRVTLSSFFKILASTRTDSQGHFAIPNPDHGLRRLTVELPDGWSCEHNPRKLTRDEREGREAIEIAVFPRDSDPVRGRLTNSANELGVPGYPLRIIAGEEQEVVVTDTTGRFTTSTSFEHGTVFWNLLEDIDSPARGRRIFEGLHSGSLIPLSIEVEPTYRLILSPAEALSDDLRACLIEPDHSPWGNERGSLDAWDQSGWGQVARPVTGLDTVLRFPKTERTERYSRLILYSMTTGWFASLTVPAGAQVHREPVRAVLERQSVLTVEFVSTAATTHAYVSVRDEQGQERNIPTTRPMIVRPGTYEFLATVPRHESHREATSLPPGPVTHRIVLTPVNIGGMVSGTVRTRSGASTKAVVALRSTEMKRSTNFAVQVDWKKGVGSFEIPDVPTGTYRLEPISDTPFEWSPSSLLVEPPRTNLEFTLLDDTETCPWDIEVTAADTGDQLRSDVRIHVDGSRQRFEAGLRPVDAKFEYTIRAHDYQLYRGYQTDFELTHVDGAPHRIARIALQPGWRIYVYVQDEEGLALGGAELVIEGEVAATTDSAGYADVRRATRPRRLIVRLPGFVDQFVSPYSGEGLVQLERE